MTQVTDADREARVRLLRGKAVGGGDGATRYAVTPSLADVDKAFARHREQAVRETVAPLQARVAELEAALRTIAKPTRFYVTGQFKWAQEVARAALQEIDNDAG